MPGKIFERSLHIFLGEFCIINVNTKRVIVIKYRIILLTKVEQTKTVILTQNC